MDFFQESDSLVTQEVDEKVQPDSLAASASAPFKETNQPTPVQHGAGEFNQTVPEPENLEKSIKSDVMKASSIRDDVAKLEPAPAIPEDATINLANSFPASKSDAFPVPPDINVIPPKIIHGFWILKKLAKIPDDSDPAGK